MPHGRHHPATEDEDVSKLLGAITNIGAPSVLNFYQFLGCEIMRPGAMKDNPEWFMACGRLLADRVLGPPTNTGIQGDDRGDDRALLELIESTLDRLQNIDRELAPAHLFS